MCWSRGREWKSGDIGRTTVLPLLWCVPPFCPFPGYVVEPQCQCCRFHFPNGTGSIPQGPFAAACIQWGPDLYNVRWRLWLRLAHIKPWLSVLWSHWRLFRKVGKSREVVWERNKALSISWPWTFLGCSHDCDCGEGKKSAFDKCFSSECWWIYLLIPWVGRARGCTAEKK